MFKKAYDKKLCDAFPLLYADRNLPMNKTCMCWGFTVGNGWFEIIWKLSEKVEKLLEELTEERYLCACGHNKAMHERYPELGGVCTHVRGFKKKLFECNCKEFKSCIPRAAQVKEKFGGLRFYMEGSTDEIREIVREAEAECWKTCESCGTKKDVAIRKGSWVRVLCLECLIDARTTRAVKNALYLENEKQREAAERVVKAQMDANADNKHALNELDN